MSNPTDESDSSLYVSANAGGELPQDVNNLLETIPKTSMGTLESLGPEGERADDSIDRMLAPPRLAPLIADLNRWAVQAHQYEDQTEAKAGFLGIGAVEAKFLQAGLVHEAKRFLVKRTEQNRPVEIGVAVRLWIAILKKDGKLTLTIPHLAASAQLNKAQARIGITVVGFRGPLGDLLPAPESLNVENFSVYTAAFKTIQAHVLGKEGENGLAPTLLGYHEEKAKLEE